MLELNRYSENIKSAVTLKYPSFRDVKMKTVKTWFAGKRVDDGAEGLWRIHDKLYDLSHFIQTHPGGSFWIKITKGTDITEAFESHHLSEQPFYMLKQFEVRDASTKRNYTLTFEENGFYKTLKRRIKEELKTLDYSPMSKSDIIHTTVLLMTFFLAILGVIFKSNIFTVSAGIFLYWNTVAAHNYFHRKDNWRMYTFNLSMLNFHEWRVSHVLSHHMYPNSYCDFEQTMAEPFFCWLPNPHLKNTFQRYGSWFYSPFIYTISFIGTMAIRIVYSILKENVLYWDDCIFLTLPLTMYLCSGANNFIEVLEIWFKINMIGGFIFALIGINGGHHHSKIFHDGDTPRNDRDWGLFQVDTICEPFEPGTRNSQFIDVTNFGHHTLHHLFPTLDHGVLPQLYPIFFRTLKEFHGEYKKYTWPELLQGQLMQLARTKPNKVPYGEKFK